MPLPLSILLVEDEFIAAMLMKAELEKLGHRVVGSVTTGENAIAKAHEHRPDLILMDIRLAGRLDGIEAAMEIRKAQAANLVFMTGYDDPEVRARAESLEPLAYIIKPFAMAKIKHLLDALQGAAGER
ncbi:MAG: response regulator [Chthoniobacterales bacterium]